MPIPAISLGLKNTENQQFARVANPAGDAGVPLKSTNFGSEPLCDENGRLIVRIAGSGGFTPLFNPTTLRTSIPSGVIPFDGFYIDTNILDGTIYGYNDAPIPAFIQLHNFIAPIPLGNIPLISIPVGAGPGTFFKDINIAGTPAPLINLSIVLSSTQYTFTPLLVTGLNIWATYKL